MYAAITGTCENGEVTLEEPPPTLGRAKVVVMFLVDAPQDQSNAEPRKGVRLGSLAEQGYRIPDDFNVPLDLSARLTADGFNLLSLSTEHIRAYQAIPLFGDHRDPFDRVLLATAPSEGIPILSSDANFQRYRPAVQVVMNG